MAHLLNHCPRKASRIEFVGDGTAKVELTQGLYATIDAQDAETVGLFKWHAVRSGKTHYARTCTKKLGKFRSAQMHRMIAGLDPESSAQIDHIDRDGLNNRRANLRITGGTLQKLNQTVRLDNTSGVTGVHLRPDGKWQARIGLYGKRYNLGVFATSEEAVHARKMARQIVTDIVEPLIGQAIPENTDE
jgi:hypothetical protein